MNPVFLPIPRVFLLLRRTEDPGVLETTGGGLRGLGGKGGVQILKPAVAAPELRSSSDLS